MIERQFISQNIKEQQIQEYIKTTLLRVGHSHTKLQKTPLGEKITIYTSHPGLMVGRGGENIKKLTYALKKKFGLENPQIEINQVEMPNLDAYIVAERIASSLERFGASKFKGIMHKALDDVLKSGAVGVEITLSGKIPSTRSRTWRIKGGHIKKCGDIAVSYVEKAHVSALLKIGLVGIKVNIMPAGIQLPDDIYVFPTDELTEVVKVEEVTDVTASNEKEILERDGESEAVKEIKEKIKKKTTKKETKKKETKKEFFETKEKKSEEKKPAKKTIKKSKEEKVAKKVEEKNEKNQEDAAKEG